MRRAARTDRNHQDIVSEFRRLGCHVVSLAALGSGVPDLLVTIRHRAHEYVRTLLVEIKDGSKAPSARVLTPDQQGFHKAWPGELAIVTSVDDVVALVASRPPWECE